MTNFKTLQDAHLALLARQDAAPDDPALVAAAEAYIADVTAGSTWVADPGERDLLRAYLRYWAGVIYQQRGVYPKTELRPAETTAAVWPVVPSPAENLPPTAAAPRRSLFDWVSVLGGLAFLSMLIVAIFLLLGGAGFPGEDVVDPSIPNPATPLPGITRTPIPQTPMPATPIDQRNAAQVQPLTQADAHTGGALAVDFDPQKPEIATGGADGSVRFWTVPDLTLSRQLNDQRGWVRSIDYSPYGSQNAGGAVPALFLTGGNDGLLRVYDLESLQPFAEYRPSAANSGFVFAARFNPDGRLFASGHGDGQARVWNVATGTESEALSADVTSRLAQITSGGAAVHDVAFLGDGSALALALGGTDSGVLIMDRTFTNPVCLVSGGAALAVAFSPRGDRLAVARENGNLAIVPLSDCPQPQNFYDQLAHPGGATDVAFSPTGDWLVTGGRDGTLKIWSPDGTKLAELTVGAAVEAVAVSADAGYIASVDANGRLILWGIP